MGLYGKTVFELCSSFRARNPKMFVHVILKNVGEKSSAVKTIAGVGRGFRLPCQLTNVTQTRMLSDVIYCNAAVVASAKFAHRLYCRRLVDRLPQTEVFSGR